MKVRADLHNIALTALCVLGGSIVYAPCAFEENSPAALFFSLAVGTPVYILILLGINRLKTENTPAVKIIKTSVCILLVLISAMSFSSVTDYFSSAVLIKTPFAAIFTVLFLTLLAAGFCGGDAAKKMSLAAIFFVSVLIFILLAVSHKSFDIKTALKFKPTLNFFVTFLKYTADVFLLSVGAVLFQREKGAKTDVKSTAFGAVLGGALLLVTVSSSVAVLGNAPAAEFRFPYHFAVATFSAGTLFTRMDALTYFIFFTCGFVKSFICLCAARNMFPWYENHKKMFSAAFCVITALLSLAF